MATKKKAKTREEYEGMTVPELKDEAESRDVHVPSDAKKEDIVNLLATDEETGGMITEGLGRSAGDPRQKERPTEDPKRGKPAADTRTLDEEGNEIPPDPYENFADPVIDGSLPIIDQVTPSNVVIAIVIDGSNIRTMPEDGVDYDHLVFVQSGRGQEFLLPEASKRKFVQDRDGQIFYNQHGVAQNDEFKSVDMVALGT